MKVVVVGSGIGGISAAYHLAHDGHEVTLLEQNDRLGGHTYQMEIDGEQVDLGFMMFGDSNPNIKAWFKQFGVTQPDGSTKTLIPMSLTVNSDIPKDVQFSSRTPFASYGELLDVRKWKVLVDIYRFTWDLLTCQSTTNMPGMTNAQGVKNPSITTKEWAQQAGYSKEFFRHYFLAFCAILWTIPKDQVLELPVNQFLRCLRTHANSLYIPLWEVIMRAFGKATVRPKHLWYYIGSKYIEPFLKDFEAHKGQVRYNAQVQQVGKGGKEVVLKGGEKIKCDHVVLACHADESAALLPWSETAQKSLNKFVFHKSMMYVHRDPKFLPKDQRCWASWNVKITKDDEYVLTYWMNRIQRLKSKNPVFVTITPWDYNGEKPDEDTIISAFRWDHPQLLADCLPQEKILNEPGITLSGAWLGRGFHEDGFVAGRRAAAIIRDAKHTKTCLYEDPGNIPVPPVPSFKVPLSFTIGAASVVGVIGFGVYKLIEAVARK